MSEFLKPLENSKKPTPKNKVKQNFQKNFSKVQQVRDKEQEQSLTVFLAEKQIDNSEKNRQELRQFLKERQLFDENFSLEDISEQEIQRFRKNENLSETKFDWKENKSEAQTAEFLIDNWKTEGFSNYEVIQKLLQAHKSGQIALLPEKYEKFRDFFALLQNNSFGGDNAKIISVINDSNVDLSSPKAFNQVIFAVFEDETISEATKVKIGKHFNLKPIVTGDDLKENLFARQKQIKLREEQQENLEKSLFLLGQQTEHTQTRLKELKVEIRVEKNLEKKLQLEKRYDELEELLERLEKDTKEQNKQKLDLKNTILSKIVYVRGVEANLLGGEIILTIPESETKVSVPDHFDSKDIAKVVNAHVMYDLFKSLGLESYLFYPSDFLGDYPTQTTLDRNNAFLEKFGFSYDGLVLKKLEINNIRKLFDSLMLPNFYSSNLTKKENATGRLEELGLLTGRELNHRKFIEKLLWTKQFGKPSMENVA